MTEPNPAELIAQYTTIAEAFWPRIVSFALNLLAALGILIAGWILARILGGTTKRLLDRNPRVDSTLKPFLSALVRNGVLIIIVFAAVAQLGVQTASILAVMGAAGLAIGLALQGTLSNVAAGVMLLILRPLRNEEYIDADGITGTVKEVNLFNTALHSPDGVSLFVPNARLWGATIKNYSRLGRRRLDITFRIAYERDLDKAIVLLRDLVRHQSHVLSDPAPDVVTVDFTDNGVTCSVQAWVLTSDYLRVASDLRRAVKRALDLNDIGIVHAPFAYAVSEEAKAGAQANEPSRE